jgi:hypothetical protein
MSRSIEQIRKTFPYSNDCMELQKIIEKLINEKSFYALKLNKTEVSNLDKRLLELTSYFNKLNCEMTIGTSKLKEVLDISKKHQEISKIRIEAESEKEKNKRIIVGAVILLASIGIISLTFKK